MKISILGMFLLILILSSINVNAVFGVDDVVAVGSGIVSYCSTTDCINMIKTPFKKFEFSVSPNQINSRLREL